MSGRDRLHRQRIILGLTSLLTGALLFWTALHCHGCDWFISQTHADIIYTALTRFHEFPYFSWAFNGGAYFIQDPQSNLFSPALPLIAIAGPTNGLRLMEGLCGALGVLSFTSWMRRRVGFEAALVGAVASVTSLGVLWRVAAGNDMFLWHLALPALFLFSENVIRERNVRSLLAFALTLGIVLLGPTFHSLTYLFLPVMAVFVVTELIRARPGWVGLAQVGLLFVGASVIALVIMSPKLACWTQFTMSRRTGDFGPISLTSALKNLFDFTITKWQHVDTVEIVHKHRGWGVEESAVALQPIGALFAIIGCSALVVPRWKRSTALFAIILVLMGICLCVSQSPAAAFRSMSGGSFRVMQRFLYMSSFGLAVFAALGADLIFTRLQRLAAPMCYLAIALMFGSALWWTHAAGKYGGDAVCDAVYPTAIDPARQFVAERASTSHLDTYTGLVPFSEDGRDILKGLGYTDGFLVVGNDFKPRLWKSHEQRPFVDDEDQRARVTIQNQHIYVRDLKPGETISIRARLPAFGVGIRTSPEHAQVEVTENHGRLAIKNLSSETIASTKVTARFPVSRLWFGASALGLLGSLVALAILGLRDSRRSHHA